MNNFNNEDKKGGFWSSLMGLFGGGSSAAGGAPVIGGIFATKAGIMGLVLGGATIAAGVGVVYNFVGPSSKPVYTPQLFQDTYYEERAQAAVEERAMQKQDQSASASTLDIFREQAKQEGIAGLPGQTAGGAPSEGDASASADPNAAGSNVAGDGSSQDGNASAQAPGADAAANGGGARLQASSGFGGGKGGGGSQSRLSAGGGMSGGIGNQFAQIYRPPVGQNAGGLSAMKGSAAAGMKGAPKSAIPSFNKKGAFGQAKFAGKIGARAQYSADAAGSRVQATEAFSGETSGGGDVGDAGGGAGLGGAGISNGAKLKGNDPSMNSNQSDPPPVTTPEDVSPFGKLTDDIMTWMLVTFGLVVVATLLGRMQHPVAKGFAIAFAIAAMAAAAFIMYMAIMLMKGNPDGDCAGFLPDHCKKDEKWEGQKWTGAMYLMVATMLMIAAWNAMAGAGGTAATPASGTPGTTGYVAAQPATGFGWGLQPINLSGMFGGM